VRVASIGLPILTMLIPRHGGMEDPTGERLGCAEAFIDLIVNSESQAAAGRGAFEVVKRPHNGGGGHHPPDQVLANTPASCTRARIWLARSSGHSTACGQLASVLDSLRCTIKSPDRSAIVVNSLADTS
jgi:hypothetical protein